MKRSAVWDAPHVYLIPSSLRASLVAVAVLTCDGFGQTSRARANKSRWLHFQSQFSSKKRVKNILVFIVAIYVWLCLPMIAGATPNPRDVLNNAMLLISNAQTVSFEATRTKPKDTIEEQYYSTKQGGDICIRAVATEKFLGVSLSTRCIKNRDGTWEIYPDKVVDLSSIYTRDKFVSVYPFDRLSMCLTNPYIFTLSEETVNGAELFVVDGSLSSPPKGQENGANFPKEVSYKVGKQNGLLYSLHEVTFGGKTCDLRFNKMKLNPALDPKMFELPNVPKVAPSSFQNYAQIHGVEGTKMPEVRQILLLQQGSHRKVLSARIFVIVFAVASILLLGFAVVKRRMYAVPPS